MNPGGFPPGFFVGTILVLMRFGKVPGFKTRLRRQEILKLDISTAEVDFIVGCFRKIENSP
jgi:hypothetical protein